MEPIQTLNGSYKWIDELSRLLSDYNRRHRTIRMRLINMMSIVQNDSYQRYSHVKIASNEIQKLIQYVLINSRQFSKKAMHLIDPSRFLTLLNRTYESCNVSIERLLRKADS